MTWACRVFRPIRYSSWFRLVHYESCLFSAVEGTEGHESSKKKVIANTLGIEAYTRTSHIIIAISSLFETGGIKFNGAHLVHRVIKTHVILVLVTSGSLLALDRLITFAKRSFAVRERIR